MADWNGRRGDWGNVCGIGAVMDDILCTSTPSVRSDSSVAHFHSFDPLLLVSNSGHDCLHSATTNVGSDPSALVCITLALDVVPGWKDHSFLLRRNEALLCVYFDPIRSDLHSHSVFLHPAT